MSITISWSFCCIKLSCLRLRRIMMHTRSQCSRCGKTLSVKPSSATIQCPSCKFENRIPSVKSLGSQDQGRNSLVGRFIVRTKTQILRRGTVGPKSLNCMPSPLLSSKSFSGERPSRKRALLIGVTYTSTKHKLKGTIIDVKSIRSLLINTFHFREENILVLTEEEPAPEFVPTKKNIKNSLKWLVEDCQGGDSLVFYFSGHGVRQFDFDSDESDGFDETICPVDFEKEGVISDDEIKSAIVRPLKNGVTLNAIVDACHSGTVLDLSYVYNMKENKWQNKSRQSSDQKQTNGGLAISICACEDRQVAADTSSCIGKSTMIGGAMTYIFVDIVKKNPAITYGKLLESIHECIEKSNQEGCLLRRVFKGLLNNMLSQKPQLSATEEFDVYNSPFVL